MSDAPALSRLAHRALQAHALPGWSDGAIQRLLDENSESALRDFVPAAAFVHLCVEADSIVGFIANKVPRLVSLLVVDPDRQRQGIGSRLLASMFDFVAAHAPEVSVVTQPAPSGRQATASARTRFSPGPNRSARRSRSST